MIPESMNFYWSGRMCWMRWLTLWSFRKLNPSWEMNVYFPAIPHNERPWKTPETDDSAYQGHDYAENLDNLQVNRRTWDCPVSGLGAAQGSDVFQWWILHTSGGWCSDMDILWLRPFAAVHEKAKAGDAVFCLESGHLAVGLLGSSKKCRLFSDLYDDSLHNSEVTYQSFGTDLLYAHISDSVRFGRHTPGVRAVNEYVRKYSDLSVITLLSQTVYPYDWRKIPKIFHCKEPVPTGVVGIHWFGGSEIVSPFVLTLGPDTWRDARNTFTECLTYLHAPWGKSHDH